MKTDIIVEVRMTSTRLPGKPLLKILDKTVLELMIERLKSFNYIDNIIIATTNNSNDDPIVEIANKMDVLVFRGSENDVLGRVLNAALEFKTDIIVEITGDNPLIDKYISEQIIYFYLKSTEKYDFVSNDACVYDENYVFSCSNGFNTKVFSTNLLLEISKLTNHPVDREHVVNYIFKGKKNYKIYNYECGIPYNRSDIRLTLDYKEDFQVIKNVFENLYPQNSYFSALDIISYLDNNTGIKNINAKCSQAKYHYN